MRQNIHDWKQPRYRRPRNSGDKVWFGVSIVLIGVFLMLRELGLLAFDWQIFWAFSFITIGGVIALKKRFKGNSWWILTLIGIYKLVEDVPINKNLSIHDISLQIAMIIAGLAIALSYKKNKSTNCMDNLHVVTTNENQLNIDVTFAGRKEIVTSKDFKGGNINATFGGVEVNMVNADATGPMVLNCKVSFGGLELIVPSHWEIQNEVQPTLGSVEDRRAMRMNTSTAEEKKVLVLKGTCSFGSIEIKSY